MPTYSRESLKKLKTCDERLIKLFSKVVESFDNVILEGHRDQKTQDLYFSKGLSKKRWPHGEHNKMPSRAVDSVPAPVDWAKINAGDRKTIEKIYLYSGFVLGVAHALGIPIRWGGDWDGDWDITDQTFNDLLHFELKE